MAKVDVEQTYKLDIDPISAKNYIADMVSQLHEIAQCAGLEHEAILLHATSLAISKDRVASTNQR